jgi:hypothetical protein
MTAQTRLPFELDQRAEAGTLTACGGVPLLIEAFRVRGAAAIVDARVSIKRRKRGRSPAAMVEGRFARWAAGGERCEDLAPLRARGHGARAAPRAWHPGAADGQRFPGGVRRSGPAAVARRACHVPGEGQRGQGLSAANRRLIAWRQEWRPEPTATIDLDATILESQKRSAKVTDDGRTGDQPVVALGAEQDVVLADEFRDGNVPAGTGNRRLIEQALGHLPPGVERIAVRADSAACEQALLRWLEAAGHGLAAGLGNGAPTPLRRPRGRARP